MGDGKNEWHLSHEWNTTVVDTAGGMPVYNSQPNKNDIVSRLDSRGTGALSARLIVGAGRTFKSGYLNIPVNVFVIPDKEGSVVGFSFGFNIYKKPKAQ